MVGRLASLPLQAPPIPDKITDQGLLLAAFMLALGAAAVWYVARQIPAWITAWRGGNGHASIAAALAALQAEVRVHTEAVKALDSNLRGDYHDRLVPALHGLSLAALRRNNLGDIADLEEQRVKALEGKGSLNK